MGIGLLVLGLCLVGLALLKFIWQIYIISAFVQMGFNIFTPAFLAVMVSVLHTDNGLLVGAFTVLSSIVTALADLAFAGAQSKGKLSAVQRMI